MAKHHSIPTTLERISYEPALWKGLTGNEIFIIGAVNIILFSVIGAVSGSFFGIGILGFAAGALFGIFMLGVIGGKISMMKESKPAELFWVDFELKLLKKFSFKSDLFYKRQVWSLERNRK
ncbi:DUF3487 family protein [Moritella sp. F3]|uniref:DUF3487 family protein n=1 Tax=Moritella sp. F3 TaxID=2718882 RepID=UPI0018E190C8|nr:DUF3487 family protein [Moritella sp. F3]GIC77587.1 hypothetical protein FMO001_23140 [Moritella sp. F1]GIC82000.1 hypothetical protein FMO003_22810 [Moritella sp. F3]